MFKLLVEYSVERKIKIIVNEKDIEEKISKNLEFIHPEFIKLIYLYRNKNIIEVIFSENSYLLKKVIEYYDDVKKKIERIEKENKLLRKQLKKEKKARKNNLKIINNTKRDDKDTFLTYECQQGNIEKVKKLIHLGMDVNEKNKDGNTPLLIACKNGNIELVKYLLNYKEVKVTVS
ncbi:ankyrin [Neocallimastix californiae]|uniref:Ankyrin n=1 Tax=Neocallimastix californiae TaxID=1754190 RepID=A0A1Y2E5S7_9FUNG|nr:ankyrin [Neocallimastix californiae]|eukprot:ORY66911.1 ankyrin [Neocallimastix californiae]